VNSTEERLRDALHTAARTVDAFPTFTAPTRRFSFIPPLSAAAAVAAVVGGIMFFPGDPSPVPSVGEAFASSADSYQTSVYFCIERSSSSKCEGRESTDRQRQAISDTLESLPEVRKVTYESKQEAFERFRILFQDRPGIVATKKVGDIPDSFRVEAEPGSTPTIRLALSGLPGIDQIVDDEALRNASRN